VPIARGESYVNT